MLSRRALLAGTGTVAMASLAGCTDLLTGDIEATAQGIRISDDAVGATGYHEEEVESVEIDEEITVFGIGARITASSHFAVYEHAEQIEGEDGEPNSASMVMAASTPIATIAGQEINPLANYETTELAEMWAELAEDDDEADHDYTVEETYELTVLGERTDVVKMRVEPADDADDDPYADAEEGVMHLVTREHDGDFIIGWGLYPATHSHLEGEVHTMFEGIDHPVD